MTADQKLSLSTIGQIGLHSSDLNRSVECYRETLGVPFVAKFDPPGLAMFDCDGVLLMVSAVDEGGDADGEQAPGSPIYFTIDDLDGAVTKLDSRDVEFVSEPHMIARDDAGDFGPVGVETWMAFFRDPDATCWR
ncbi:MAG TPA: VOC family protein [Dehalococcoidia bacterium]|nr:VOC family protein [Dehalococcoidia bacterium]